MGYEGENGAKTIDVVYCEPGSIYDKKHNRKMPKEAHSHNTVTYTQRQDRQNRKNGKTNARTQNNKISLLTSDELQFICLWLSQSDQVPFICLV